jgi:outer membrane protein OmpA-like peptidoglycan-associated protein
MRPRSRSIAKWCTLPAWTVLGAATNVAGAAAPSPVTGVPLCPGLTIVTAIAQPEGDYESIKTIESVDGGLVRLRYSTEHPVRDFPGGPSHIQKLKLTRVVRADDLAGSDLYLQQFQTNVPIEVPGTTAIGTSGRVLDELETRGTARLAFFDLPPAIPSSPKIPADLSAHPNVRDYMEYYAIRRDAASHVMMSVTVNGEKTALPAVHATGRSEYYGYKGEFFFLDDASNPLALAWRLRIGAVLSGPQAGGDRDTLRVVKISYHCSPTPGGVSPLEQALSQHHRVQVYDIYFSFNSDGIRDESERSLREIGQILQRHPEWKLSIEGHTDGIASQTFNVDLSRRRAAAVKQALITRYGIASTRLTTAGYGKSRPIDTNDTPEGRARNRRVELVREE